MRIACPPLVYACEFLNFSRSRSILDLATRRTIKQLENREDADVSGYADENSSKHSLMIETISQNLGLTSLRYQKLNDLVDAIGLPKEKLCTHCWDGSSYF